VRRTLADQSDGEIHAVNVRHPEDVYRFLKTPDGQPGLNYFCSGIKRFSTYADPFLRQIAEKVQRKRDNRLLGTSVEMVSWE